MTTLAVRLSGPEQSWGSAGLFQTRTTEEAPTYSGLLGLARAALGHGRNAPREEIDWLLRLDMAVRIDSTGYLLKDFHTVNPRDPILDEDAPLAAQERKRLSGVTTASGAPWVIGGKLQTLVTERFYRTNATFLWLIEGDTHELQNLCNALDHPRWALSLGRKRCVPDWNLTLGIFPQSAVETAQTVPIISRDPSIVALHLITPNLIARHQDAIPLGSWNDAPLGSHPHQGYATNPRAEIYVDPPTRSTQAELREWLTTCRSVEATCMESPNET